MQNINTHTPNRHKISNAWSKVESMLGYRMSDDHLNTNVLKFPVNPQDFLYTFTKVLSPPLYPGST